MKVFKFGGASVKDAAGIQNLYEIVSAEKEDLIIVISAFGKTTNALEKVLKLWLEDNSSYLDHLDNIYSYHASLSDELFPGNNTSGNTIDNSFSDLRKYLRKNKKSTYDEDYDQIVSYGEIWSTSIVAEYLKNAGLNVAWVDIRKNLLTDNCHREANILWDESRDRMVGTFDFKTYNVFVTQGFIGGTKDGRFSTLGREGSDYTAAVLANMLDARSVTVWKDVPGLLNADPKWLPDARKMEEISYREAVEITFSGAKIIHPKTIKPLHNKNIPLYVRSFLNLKETGTVIKSDASLKEVLPVFIRKQNQLLISILPKDFSFAIGDNLSRIFQLFKQNCIRVNLVEASAVSIDVCVDDDRSKVDLLLADLKNEYSAFYNDNVEMLSIRHYTEEAITRITSGRDIMLEQRTRSTVRFVVKAHHLSNASLSPR